MVPGHGARGMHRVSQPYFATGQLSDLGEVTGSSGKATLSLGLLMWEVAGLMLLSQSFQD